MSERELWLAGEVEVGEALRHVVFVLGRDLIERIVDGVGQPPCRIVVADQNAGERGAGFFSGIPGGQNSGYVRLGPLDGNRARRS